MNQNGRVDPKSNFKWKSPKHKKKKKILKIGSIRAAEIPIPVIQESYSTN